MLIALSGTNEDCPLNGFEVLDVLKETRRPLSASTLLAILIQLEAASLVHIERGDQYRFYLTGEGQLRVYESGPGEPRPYLIMMLDLAGFTEYTQMNGDKAARDLSDSLYTRGSKEAKAKGGRVVKSLGDGLLTVVPPRSHALELISSIRATLTSQDGSPWPLHVGCHLGSPIEHKGDIFGSDVNLTSRLCALASDDEVVFSSHTFDETMGLDGISEFGSCTHEVVKIRGIEEPLSITRVSLI
ncbi:MAG: adenylate/guanylate cyclase domain-containing protein [Acidimicrobiales bacterium]|nr:adenylate/guanylate cyclase domain-containing protein [Acidimicrobiales bacterium]